jgi:PAS domain S-box-containing protein
MSPVQDESGVRGVLVICKDVTDEHLSRERLRALNAELADEVRIRQRAQADLASERDRINAALGQSQHDLARQLNDWKLLHEMSSRLLQAPGLDQQFDIILRTVTRFHSSDHGVISLYCGEQGGLVARASLGLSAEGLARLGCTPSGAGACGLAYGEGRRVVVRDTETDAVYAPYREFAAREGIRALYSTPFFSSAGQALGVISVYFREARSPSERELQLTDLCAGQIGLFVERERSQRQLNLEQERSHRILQTLKDGFVLLDRDFRVVQINAAGLAMDGRAAEEIVGRIHWDVWPDSEHNAAGRAYRTVMRERRPVALQHTYDYFGRLFTFDLYAYPYEDGIAILYRDITAQTRAAEELRSSEERFRTLITTIDEGYCVLEIVLDDAGRPSDYRFLEANRAFEEQSGLVNATGRTIRELVPGIESHWIDIYGRVALTGEAVRRAEHAPSMGRWFDVYATRIGDPEALRVAVLFKDVTQQKDAEAHLRRLADDLARANQRQSEFLATLAHELRNPLAPIRTGLDLMRLNPGNAQSMARVRDMMERQTDHLIHLVNDLLDLARIRNGKIELKKTRATLGEIVAAAIETTLPAIEAKRHALRLTVPDEPLWIFGDRNRLVQVIGNLLTNAAKYTPDNGSIAVTVYRDGEEALIDVADNGIGIAQDSLTPIFDIFTQVGWDATQGGLGIGLSLVRQLTEMHGGSVKAASSGPGRGSTFSVRLPLLTGGIDGAAPLLTGTPDAGAAGLAGLDILLADDNVDAVDITRELLELRGHRVRIAHNGMQALALARAELPDVALLDIGMPGMNGYELAAALRKLPQGDRLFLAAVTGWGTQDDKERSCAAGFDLHLTKPIDLDTLDRLLADCR